MAQILEGQLQRLLKLLVKFVLKMHNINSRNLFL